MAYGTFYAQIINLKKFQTNFENYLFTPILYYYKDRWTLLRYENTVSRYQPLEGLVAQGDYIFAERILPEECRRKTKDFP